MIDAKAGMTVKERQQRSDTSSKFEHVTEHSIERLVDEFYKRVRLDPILAPIFARAIASGDWGPHLSTMQKFWSSVMLTSGRYKGNPVAKHFQLAGIEPPLFDHWLALFAQTCRELFIEEVANAFVVKAERIAESLKVALFYRPDQSRSGSLA
jgi:hemoglobin